MKRQVLLAVITAVVVIGGYHLGQLLSPGPPATAIAVEPADEQALATMTDWSALPVFTEGIYQQQSSKDRATGKPVMQPLWENGNRDMNNFLCASKDAKAPKSRVPFVLELDSCPEAYVRGFVMARFEGSGRLSRVWLTAASIRRNAADRELLRIYVDDEDKPLIQVPLSKMLDGSGGEIFRPPFGAGSGRRLAWYYPVVFGSKLIITLDRLGARDLYYYQADVVLDPTPRPRRASSKRSPARDSALKLLGAKAPPGGTPRSKRLLLPVGEPVTAFELTGPATIVSAAVRLGRDQLTELGQVDLTVTWDDQKLPAIALPLSDLFAVFEAAPMASSLALASRFEGDDLELSLRLPMPFAKRAKWVLTNKGDDSFHLGLALQVTGSVPSRPWGHLRTQRFETHAPAPPGAHTIAEVSGRGRLVGTCMLMQGHGLRMKGMRGHPMNFLEGDERATIDGKLSIAGTGTEDYFNSSFYFEANVSATPFAQVWGIVDNPRKAEVSACRWHVLGDAIDFRSSLHLEMEIGPNAPEVLDNYRSVAFLYR